MKFEEHEFSHGVSGEKKTFFLASGPKDGPLIIFVHGWPAIAKTWKHQIETFPSLGFRVVAPDMPGYGRSSARKVTTDYSLEQINDGMVALIDHLGRDQAIWVGHDWGCGAVWSFAEHYPERCIGAAGLAVPSHVIELGLEQELSLVNRELYPIDKYPYGQWSYQAFYEQDFDKATSWFDADPAAFLRACYARGNPSHLGHPAMTSNVVKDGGWMGGVAKPDVNLRKIPASAIAIDEELYSEVVAAMEKTGFWGADAWYSNHETNRKYYFEKAKNGGYLHMPTLFVQAKYDTVCDTVNSRLAEPQRKHCTNLTEASVDAGHWVPQEKPQEVNGIIARWILESCTQSWPGYWSRGFIKSKV